MEKARGKVSQVLNIIMMKAAKLVNIFTSF